MGGDCDEKIKRYDKGADFVLWTSDDIMCNDRKPGSEVSECKCIRKNKTTVEITWKKKSVSGYEIYRAKRNKSGEYTYYQKIATVSGNEKKYTDKTVDTRTGILIK